MVQSNRSCAFDKLFGLFKYSQTLDFLSGLKMHGFYLIMRCDDSLHGVLLHASRKHHSVNYRAKAQMLRQDGDMINTTTMAAKTKGKALVFSVLGVFAAFYSNTTAA
jgi:hypothetical protein